MDNGEAILNEILENMQEDAETKFAKRVDPEPFPDDDDEDAKPKKDNANFTQWALGGNGRFMPVGGTKPKLPAGIYEPFAQPGSWGVELIKIASDGIYSLPDMATEAVLDEVKQFWNSEDRYRKHNLLYKRGIILWGPPGGGKTVTVKMLMNELVKDDGIVIVVSNVNLAVVVLKAIRRIEPTRRLIVVMEDVDEIINYQGEASLLSMLDGETNIDNVLNLATTNHPERLGARIINRPSRFDRRIYVGMPQNEARKVYLTKTTNDGLTPAQLEQWVTDTDGMSIAHLRELVAAVYCLGQSYTDVIERLQNMAKQPTGEEGFKRGRMGFGETLQKATVRH